MRGAENKHTDRRRRRPIALIAAVLLLTTAPLPAHAATRRLLWGDTHLHTSNSFDAFLNLNHTADPHTAYRYAKGLPVVHPGHRARIRIGTPLDFLVVADHAEFYGAMRHAVQRGVPRDDLGAWDGIVALFGQTVLRQVTAWDYGREFFASLLPPPGATPEDAAAQGLSFNAPGGATMVRTMWQEAIRIADEHNDPGTFTTLIGWEWSSIPGGANLHRVVFTSADATTASQFQPFSSIDSAYPEDLWTWLQETSEATGAEFVAIPHNSNISKGRMFAETNLRGEPFTPESARTRARWEPVVEATQFKGDSETHPELSPADPFADFETYPFYIQNDPPPYEAKPGDYVRSALRRGLAIEEKIGFNPYRFGLIGSTDAHTGIASAEEPNFWGKFPRDSIPEAKDGRGRAGRGPTGWSMSASGLAAVWAETNSRDAILEAFRRREVYATTGPRIAVRVYGGWHLEPANLETDVAHAGGVPMGAELPPGRPGETPRFLVHALKDPTSGHLDRIQIIKGWIDAEGRTHERVHDVAWAGERSPDGQGRIPAVGNTVDVATATYTNDIGASELAGWWEDPDFDAAESAFYYVRVLEIPTPRHSLYDAVALGVDPATVPAAATIQERAYTSPIWYRPASASPEALLAPEPPGQPTRARTANARHLPAPAWRSGDGLASPEAPKEMTR